MQPADLREPRSYRLNEVPASFNTSPPMMFGVNVVHLNTLKLHVPGLLPFEKTARFQLVLPQLEYPALGVRWRRGEERKLLA